MIHYIISIQEDVNGEKLTVKKWWIFGADFSRSTQSFSRFIRDINGEKKNLVIDDFFTVSFSRFAPSRSIVNHYVRVVDSLRIVNSLRVLFSVCRGSLGILACA